jgi:hypothetical protein
LLDGFLTAFGTLGFLAAFGALGFLTAFGALGFLAAFGVKRAIGLELVHASFGSRF